MNGVRAGRDVHPDERYSSLTRNTFIDQSTIRQRTAAEIVGVAKSRSPAQNHQGATQNSVSSALKHNPNQAGLNSQRQVAHINDGTWSSKMNVNNVNPYLAGTGLSSSIAVPKNLKTTYGDAALQNHTTGHQHQSAPRDNHLVESQQVQFADDGQNLRRSIDGAITNDTRGLHLRSGDFPVILNGEVVVTDGTLKPNYSRLLL